MRHRLSKNWLLLVGVLSGLLGGPEGVFKQRTAACWGQSVSTAGGEAVRTAAAQVRAEDWLITALDGDYALVDSSRGRLVQLATTAGGKSNHAVEYRPTVGVITLSDSVASGKNEESLKTGNAGARLNCAKIKLI